MRTKAGSLLQFVRKPLAALVMAFLVISICAIGYKLISQSNVYQILIVGDSIGNGEGCDDYANKWFKFIGPHMEETYNRQVEITNVSMGGNSSYAGYARIMMLEEDKDYDLVIVCYGQNDKEEGFSRYYESILRAINQKYPSCGVISILESSQQTYTAKMQIIQSLAEHYGVSVADTIKAFAESGKAYEELTNDGCHPNDEGQRLYYETVIKLIDEMYVKQKPEQTEHSDIPPVNDNMEQFKSFTYYPKEKFRFVDRLTYEVDVKNISGSLGINYHLPEGEHSITVSADGENICEKKMWCDNPHMQECIEVLAEDCAVKETIRLSFSDIEVADAFKGICINTMP